MKVELNDILVNRNRIEYVFSYDDEMSRFILDTPFYIEYMTDVDFSDVPHSVLAIPFVVNFLPMSWFFGAEITVGDIDKSLFKSIPNIEAGVKKIYPNIDIKSIVNVNGEILSNSYTPSNKTTCLFSGGVDATFTFLRHKEEKPTLVNAWGVDVRLDDLDSHLEMRNCIENMSKLFGVDYIFIKSTLRRFFNENLLNTEGYKIISDYWWHGAQHSIGLLSLLAPYNYINKVKTNYIASTFTDVEFSKGVKCISYPFVDNELKMLSANCVHDGYEAMRIDKVKYICKERMSNNWKLDLKVCFFYKNGTNCSACEKCYRTMLAILVYDSEIEKYGFSLKKPNAKEIRRFLDTHEIGDFRWLPIQKAYNEYGKNENITWLKDYKFNNLSSIRSRALRLLDKIKKIFDY